MARRTYSDETKAQVMAALLAGQSVTEAAGAYQVPRGTVARWSAQMNQQEGGVSSVSKQEKQAIGDLLVAYLEESLQTLTEQVRFARSVTWLEKQPASDFAVLHGVQMDKAIKLFEAMARASGNQATDD